ncbi:hypothetical protein N9U48_01050 [Bacteroidota bacterium]|nr:hypothetical protein [Bacteroidota bacterium]
MYKFLTTINFFELQSICQLFDSYNINLKIKNNYNPNITAGWVDSFCTYNERELYVLEKDFVLAKKILLEYK